jgi:hypothetical protein
VLALVNADRDGEAVDRALLKSITDLYRELQDAKEPLYKRDFEAPLLEASRAYFSSHAAMLMASDSVPAYLLKAEAYLDAEEERVTAVLHLGYNPIEDCTRVCWARHWLPEAPLLREISVAAG